MGCGASAPGEMRSGQSGLPAPVAEKSALPGELSSPLADAAAGTAATSEAPPLVSTSEQRDGSRHSDATNHGGDAVLAFMSTSPDDEVTEDEAAAPVPPAAAAAAPSTSGRPTAATSTAAGDASAAVSPQSAAAPASAVGTTSGGWTDTTESPRQIALPIAVPDAGMLPGTGRVAALMMQHNNRYASNGGVADSMSVPSEVTSPSASSLDDEDEDAPFTLPRWRQFYKWNKRKHTDLLGFLWKKFESPGHSIFCVSYRFHDLMFAAFQGSNLLHGLFCRLEGEPLFGVGQVLYDLDSPEKFMAVAVFIVPGEEVPACVSSAVDYPLWQWLKADAKDPLVRQFLSQVITGKAPSAELGVLTRLECNTGA